MKKTALFLIWIFLISYQAFAYDFSSVDDIISKGILNHAFPGAQILVGNDKEILYNKSYGNFTYDDFSAPVTDECMFDLASVTKVVATTSAIMKLYQEKKINLTDKVSDYINEFANNGKEGITILNLLLHNSGLTAFIPFYKTLSTREEVLNAIYNTRLEYRTNSKFLYSDLNAILLGIIVEKVSGMKLNEYCDRIIFTPLNMHSTTFIPGENLKNKILPTEVDNYWRNRLIQGEVHDESAAMLGGVSGNAGLFSNTKDLYLFMKTMLNNGNYINSPSGNQSNEILFENDIVSLFTKKYSETAYENSRALGWDTRPLQSSSKYRIPCGELISENCFGHTGFTGTSIWCDRDRNLIIIFLTNRIYPSRDNYGIRDVRPDVHNAAIQVVSNQ